MVEKSSYDSEKAQSGLSLWKKRRSSSSFKRKVGFREIKDQGTELGEYSGLIGYLNNFRISPEDFELGLKKEKEQFNKAFIEEKKTENDPDYVDKEGIKYWINYSITRHALEKGINDVLVFDVEDPNGCKTILLVRGSKLIFESQKVDHIETKINTLALIESNTKDSNE